jgi:tetratricopeptide (TPR) repeat protein
MLESKAKLIEMQGNRARLNDKMSSDNNKKKKLIKDEILNEKKKSKIKLNDAIKNFQKAIGCYKLLPVNARSQRGICRAQEGLCNVRRKLFDASNANEVTELLNDYDIVIQLCKNIGDQALEATQHKNKGVVLKERAKYCKDNKDEYNKILNTALISYQKASEVQGRLGEIEERVKSLRGIAGVQNMLNHLDEAIIACEESIVLARACGYKAGETRAQVVQCDIFLSMVEKNANQDYNSITTDLQKLIRTRSIGENLLDNEQRKKKVKSGDVARAMFIVARIYMAIIHFMEEDDEKDGEQEDRLLLSKDITMERIIKLLKESKNMFVSGNDTNWIKQIKRYTDEHNIELPE